MKSGFHPIGLEEYAKLHVKANPSEKYKDVVERLKQALASYKADERCNCGEPIWVIGSSVAGVMCFTCITGEAYPSEDYEIAEACGTRKKAHRGSLR